MPNPLFFFPTTYALIFLLQGKRNRRIGIQIVALTTIRPLEKRIRPLGKRFLSRNRDRDGRPKTGSETEDTTTAFDRHLPLLLHETIPERSVTWPYQSSRTPGVKDLWCIQAGSLLRRPPSFTLTRRLRETAAGYSPYRRLPPSLVTAD